MDTDSQLGLQPPRGMRDFYPDEMALRTAIFDAWTLAARRHGFQQYDACVVESLDLLKRKAGEEIVGQIYSFQDKSGRDLALRAEMTPTLARMVAARQGALAFPLKWFTIAQCFRYERMTRGRKREHYQWNLDIIGESSVAAEAEIIRTAASALDLLGLGPAHVAIHINSRALLSDLLDRLGLARDTHGAAFLALDKRGKLDQAEIEAQLAAAGLSASAIAATMGLTAIASLEEAAGILKDQAQSYRQLADLFRMLADYGLGDMVKFDISVVRGLGYYTGVVFEAFDAQRSLRAIFGGGRYDNLLADVGGKPTSAVGLGFGDVVLGELLTELGLAPGGVQGPDLSLSYMEEAQRSVAMAITQAVRKQGRSVDLGLGPQKAKAFFSRANRSGCRLALYIGPDDLARGTVRIKTMADGGEREASVADLAAGRFQL